MSLVYIYVVEHQFLEPLFFEPLITWSKSHFLLLSSNFSNCFSRAFKPIFISLGGPKKLGKLPRYFHYTWGYRRALPQIAGKWCYKSKIAAIKIQVLKSTFILNIWQKTDHVADIPSSLEVLHQVESCIIIPWRADQFKVVLPTMTKIAS